MELLDFSSREKCEEYERFVRGHASGSFTQSLLWCGVKSGWRHEAVVVRDNGRRISATMLVLIRRLPGLQTSFLYSPRGPVCDFREKNTLLELTAGVEILARRYHACFFKCDPLLLSSDEEGIRNLRELGYVLEPDPDENTIQCRCNYQLPVKGRTADDVFQSFQPKWRYNIRLAERRGVVCRYYDRNSLEGRLDEFYPLMRETGSRDGFNIRSEGYFHSLLDNLYPYCRLYLCYHENRAVSGAVAVQYAGKTCYVYGASSGMNRSVMPNYLMQWSMIRWALENGGCIYDFQGIPHYSDETHPNYGVYRFKKGFNGQVVEYAGEFDLVFHPRLKREAGRLYQVYNGFLQQKNRLKCMLEGTAISH